MTAKSQAKSRILESMHETGKDLHAAGFIDKRRMHEYDALCLAPVPEYSSKKIRALRTRHKLSQAVLTAVLNTSLSTVRQWEADRVAGFAPDVFLCRFQRRSRARLGCIIRRRACAQSRSRKRSSRLRSSGYAAGASKDRNLLWKTTGTRAARSTGLFPSKCSKPWANAIGGTISPRCGVCCMPMVSPWCKRSPSTRRYLKRTANKPTSS
jgi:putative transcriptional regulator